MMRLRRPVAVYRILDEDELLGKSPDPSEPYPRRDFDETGPLRQGRPAPTIAAANPTRYLRRLVLLVLGVGGVCLLATLTLARNPNAPTSSVRSAPQVVPRSHPVDVRARAVATSALLRARRPVTRRSRVRHAARPTRVPSREVPLTVRPSSAQTASTVRRNGLPSSTQEFGFER
jgi:hypothetical protein